MEKRNIFKPDYKAIDALTNEMNDTDAAKHLGISGSILYIISGYIKDALAIHAIYRDTDLAMLRKLNAYKTHWEPRR